MGAVSEYNRHGLADVARRWNPKTMRDGVNAANTLDLINALAADALNILIDLEQYAPILFNPTRCLGNDVKYSLTLNGVEPSTSLTAEQSRRIAIIASTLRLWRGAFVSMRSLVTAITGGPVVITTWMTDAPVVGVSSWDMLLLGEEDVNTSQVFLLGDDFSQGQLNHYVGDFARTALDATAFVACFTLTAWRDGPGKWTAPNHELTPSNVAGEFESLDIGPSVSAAYLHRVVSSDSHTQGANLWATVWFITEGATDGSSWRFVLASNGASSPSAYGVRVSVGNHNVALVRIDSGTDTVLGVMRCSLRDSSLAWHRIDVLLKRTPTTVSMRVLVNGCPSGIYSDSAPSRPNGRVCEYWTVDSDFPSGKLRTTAITAVER